MRNWLAPIVAVVTQALAIRGAVGPFVFADELGYVAAARYFGPGDQDVQMLAAFYHFGYGLLLAPLTVVFSEPGSFYRAATVLNAGLIVLATVIFDRLVLRRSLAVSPRDASLAAVGFALAPSLLVNSSIVWAESALVLAITLVLAALLSLVSAPSIGRAAAVGVAAAACYALHPRAVAVVVAAVGAVAVAAMVGRLRVSLVAPTFLAAAVGVMAVRWANGLIAAALYTEGSVTQSAGGIADLIAEQPGQWAAGLIGTAWYQLLASGGLVGFGVLWWGNDVRLARHRDVRDAAARSAIGSTFLLIAIGLSWLVGAVIAIGPDSRIDHLIYGRYLDIFAPFAVGFGLLWLVGQSRPSRRWSGVVVATIALLGLVLVGLGRADGGSQEVVRVNIPVSSALEHLGASWSPFGQGLVAIVAASVLISVLWRQAEAGVALFAVFSLVVASVALQRDVYPASAASTEIQALAESTETLAENGTVFLTGPYESWMLYGLQYWADDVQFELETHCPGASHEVLVAVPDDARYLDWAIRGTDPTGQRVLLSDPDGHASLSRSLSSQILSSEILSTEPAGTTDPLTLVLQVEIENTDDTRPLEISDPQVLGLFVRWYHRDHPTEPLAATLVETDVFLSPGQKGTYEMSVVLPALPAGGYEVRVEPRADGWVWLTTTPCGRATAGSATLPLE